MLIGCLCLHSRSMTVRSVTTRYNYNGSFLTVSGVGPADRRQQASYGSKINRLRASVPKPLGARNASARVCFAVSIGGNPANYASAGVAVDQGRHAAPNGGQGGFPATLAPGVHPVARTRGHPAAFRWAGG